MGRKKLVRAYISDGMARNTTFKQRKKGLIKKLDELKILCDVEACAVIYEPFNSSNPDVWPSNSGAINVIEKFEMLPEKEKTCKSVNHEEFLIQEIAKDKKTTQNLTEQNKQSRMKELMFGHLSGNMGGLIMQDNDRPALCRFIDQYLKDLVYHKNVTLNNPQFQIGESSSMAVARNMAPDAMTAVMAPLTTAESGSFSFMKLLQSTISSNPGPEHVNSLASNYMNAPTFNYPQVTSELNHVISSNPGPRHVKCLASNYLNAQTFNYPKVTNELNPVISSIPGPGHINSLASNYLNAPTFNYPQVTSELNPVISSNPGPGHVSPLASNYLNAPTFNYPQVTSELNPVISSNPGPGHVSSLASNYLNTPTFNYPQVTSELNPVISSNPGPGHVSSLASNYLNVPTFNYPQVTSELNPVISSNSGSGHVNSLASNYLNTPTFNYPQVTNELNPVISLNPGQGHVSSLASNYLNAPTFNYLQVTSELNPIISSNPGPEHDNFLASNPLPSSDQEVYIPVKNEEEFLYPYQNQDQQFVEEMMKLGEQTGFESSYNHQF